MQTNKIVINNKGRNLEKALQEIESFSEHQHLGRRDSLHVRLLAEEMFGMVRQMTGDFNAYFWAEGDERSCDIILEANAHVDLIQRENLLSASSSGRNILATGMMGKIGEVLETFSMGYEPEDEKKKKKNKKEEDSLDTVTVGLSDQDDAVWSMKTYRDRLDEERDAQIEAADAWDELERSIVANLADDVQIGVRKNRVKMVVRLLFKE